MEAEQRRSDAAGGHRVTVNGVPFDFEDFLQAIDDPEVAILVQTTGVAGMEPAMRVERFFRRLLVVEIRGEQELGPDQDLADFVDTHGCDDSRSARLLSPLVTHSLLPSSTDTILTSVAGKGIPVLPRTFSSSLHVDACWFVTP